MNMNRDIVNRALLLVGQQPLADEDFSEPNTVYLLCRQFYLEAFLEALSEVSWTGGRKRDRLMKTGRPYLKSGYRFTYDVPFDCARPIELQNNEYFIVEDRFICTDADKAELLYITNGKILRTVAGISCGGAGDLMDMEYLSCGGADTDPEVTIQCGGAADIPDVLPPDPAPNEDFPDYRPPQYEPKFYEYIQTSLAAKFAMKLSNDPGLHVQLLQEALLIRQDAVTASMGASAAKLKPKKWWAEELGLK